MSYILLGHVARLEAVIKTMAELIRLYDYENRISIFTYREDSLVINGQDEWIISCKALTGLLRSTEILAAQEPV